MKKFMFTFAAALIMSPLCASTAEFELASWDCHEMAEAGADAAEGDDAAKFEVYDAVYQECLDQGN